MLYRLVRPMFRDGSQNGCFNRRIPSDVRKLAVGLRLSLPIGEEFASVSVSANAKAVRLPLRTSDPLEVKARTARLDEHLEQVFKHKHQEEPTLRLTKKQMTLLWSNQQFREFRRAHVIWYLENISYARLRRTASAAFSKTLAVGQNTNRAPPHRGKPSRPC